ncbi:hypothetical protein H0H93_000567, partial [Arthromyces matolae]
SSSLVYAFKQRRHSLLKLCALWKGCLRSLSVQAETLPDWGPSKEELLQAGIERVTLSVDMIDEDELSEGGEEDDFDDAYLEMLDTAYSGYSDDEIYT